MYCALDMDQTALIFGSADKRCESRGKIKRKYNFFVKKGVRMYFSLKEMRRPYKTSQACIFSMDVSHRQPKKKYGMINPHLVHCTEICALHT